MVVKTVVKKCPGCDGDERPCRMYDFRNRAVTETQKRLLRCENCIQHHINMEVNDVLREAVHFSFSFPPHYTWMGKEEQEVCRRKINIIIERLQETLLHSSKTR
jgi:hypothetical protein